MTLRGYLLKFSLVLFWLAISGCGERLFTDSHDRAIDHYVSALSLQYQQKTEEAIYELQQALRDDIDFVLAHSMMGEMYRGQGKNKEAAVAFELACKIDPWSYEDHLNLGQVYQVLKRFYDAIAALNRATVLHPESAIGHHNLGQCYYETNDFEKALTAVDRASELDPDNPLILASLGNIHAKGGDPYEAIRVYQQALELNPDDIEVMVQLGTVYTDMKRFAPARLVLEKAAEIAPDQPGPHVALAYSLLKEEQYPQAIQAYESAIALDENSYLAQSGYAAANMILYLRTDRKNNEYTQKALRAWHRSLEIEPEQPRVKKLIEKYTRQLAASTPPPPQLRQPLCLNITGEAAVPTVAFLFDAFDVSLQSII